MLKPSESKRRPSLRPSTVMEPDPNPEFSTVKPKFVADMKGVHTLERALRLPVSLGASDSSPMELADLERTLEEEARESPPLGGKSEGSCTSEPMLVDSQLHGIGRAPCATSSSSVKRIIRRSCALGVTKAVGTRPLVDFISTLLSSAPGPATTGEMTLSSLANRMLWARATMSGIEACGSFFKLSALTHGTATSPTLWTKAVGTRLRVDLRLPPAAALTSDTSSCTLNFTPRGGSEAYLVGTLLRTDFGLVASLDAAPPIENLSSNCTAKPTFRTSSCEANFVGTRPREDLSFPAALADTVDTSGLALNCTPPSGNFWSSGETNFVGTLVRTDFAGPSDASLAADPMLFLVSNCTVGEMGGASSPETNLVGTLPRMLFMSLARDAGTSDLEAPSLKWTFPIGGRFIGKAESCAASTVTAFPSTKGVATLSRHDLICLVSASAACCVVSSTVAAGSSTKVTTGARRTASSTLCKVSCAIIGVGVLPRLLRIWDSRPSTSNSCTLAGSPARRTTCPGAAAASPFTMDARASLSSTNWTDLA
mmetsp:Transcript_62855/g.175135  ORF Transcript_62855/g.175135 Transcript_62855/m.175135 type:complete len:540 (-) Transcript_62855:1118-2737(-)